MRLRNIVITVAMIAGVLASTTVASLAAANEVAAPSKPCGEIRDHPVLSQGDSGTAVRHAQCLIRNGFHDGIDIDGDFGPQTRTYVAKAQTTCHIKVDGIIGTDTWNCLHSRN